jgi:hypothetical protein
MASVKDGLKAKGRVAIVLKDKNGQVKETRDINNLVVDDGLQYIISRMKNTTPTAMSHMQIGTGVNSPAGAVAGDSDIKTKFRDKESASSSIAANGLSITYSATFGAHSNDPTQSIAESTPQIVEAAITNNSANATGDCLCRVEFPVVSKGPEDSITISWQISLSAS